MSTISQRDSNVTWHPYTPMKVWPEAIGIVRGEGSYLIAEDGTRYLDAISSWWVTIHGHSHPYIAQKVYEQMTTLEHCMFAGFTHLPAVALAERLLQILPGSMSRVFYSDNGSTAVEVALKMAIQYWSNKGIKKQKIVAIENAYHGDTFGAMAVSARSIFTASFTDYLFDVAFIPFPGAGKEEACLAAFTALLQQGDVAAFIAEPLVQGSAGMQMYSTDTLEQLFATAKQYNTLIIADEVMTGFGRTGTLFACEQISTSPDIICLSKGITGGAMPMGVTTATADIFDAFYHDDRSKMLYHGHSYTANATICAAALASMDLLLQDTCTASRQQIADAHAAFGKIITHHPSVAEIRQTGTILAIELRTSSASYHSTLRDRIYRFFISRHIILRPLGHIIYILPPYCITTSELNYVYDSIAAFLEEIRETK